MKTATRVVAGDPTRATGESERYGASRHVARFAAIITVLLGCSVLLGWALDIAILKKCIPDAVATMKANTATSFVLAGLSLAFQIEPHPSRRSMTIARGLALLAASIGLLTLLEYLFGGDFGIDQLLATDAPDRFTLAPGRMAPGTALSFVFMGADLSTNLACRGSRGALLGR